MSAKIATFRSQPLRRSSANTADHALVIFIVAAIALGGASVRNSLPALILQCLSVLVLAVNLWRIRPPPAVPKEVWLGAFALITLCLVQIIPFPASLWSQLPGPEILRDSLAAAGRADGPRPLSLDPMATIAALTSLLPAAAALSFVSRAGAPAFPTLAIPLLCLVAASWVLGVLQFMGSNDSSLYFHSPTNLGLAVGFYSNANHLGLLLAIGAPVAAGLLGERVREKRMLPWHAVTAVGAYAALAALGIALTGSVAGITLLAVGLVFGGLLLPSSWQTKLVAGAICAVATALGAIVSAGLLGTDFEGVSGRPDIWRTTWEGIATFWPAGSGIGTYPTAYPLFENVVTINDRMVNHAHNDYLEWLFEGGMLAALLIILGLGWWCVRSYQVWSRPASGNVIWQRVSSIVVGLILGHSSVDYPLRTPAVLVIFTIFVLGLAWEGQATSENRDLN